MLVLAILGRDTSGYVWLSQVISCYFRLGHFRSGKLRLV
jgi:hypothetical protein